MCIYHVSHVFNRKPCVLEFLAHEGLYTLHCVSSMYRIFLCTQVVVEQNCVVKLLVRQEFISVSLSKSVHSISIQGWPGQFTGVVHYILGTHKLSNSASK